MICKECGSEITARTYTCKNCDTLIRHIFYSKYDQEEGYSDIQKFFTTSNVKKYNHSTSSKLTELIRNNDLDEIYKLSKKLIDSKDIDNGLWGYKYLLEKENEDAIWDMGYNYAVGNIVKKDLIKSNELFLRLAKNGNVGAMYNLALGYSDVDDVENEFYWFKEAAENGYVDAYIRVAFIYDENGNETEAIKWYKLAGENGEAKAYHNIGCMMESSNNMKEAVKYFELAAKGGNITSAMNIALYYHENGYLNDARKWYEFAANKNNADAQYNLGLLLAKEYQDLKGALVWLEKARSNGISEASMTIEDINRILAGNY